MMTRVREREREREKEESTWINRFPLGDPANFMDLRAWLGFSPSLSTLEALQLARRRPKRN